MTENVLLFEEENLHIPDWRVAVRNNLPAEPMHRHNRRLRKITLDRLLDNVGREEAGVFLTNKQETY